MTPLEVATQKERIDRLMTFCVAEVLPYRDVFDQVAVREIGISGDTHPYIRAWALARYVPTTTAAQSDAVSQLHAQLTQDGDTPLEVNSLTADEANARVSQVFRALRFRYLEGDDTDGRDRAGLPKDLDTVPLDRLITAALRVAPALADSGTHYAAQVYGTLRGVLACALIPYVRGGDIFDTLTHPTEDVLRAYNSLLTTGKF